MAKEVALARLRVMFINGLRDREMNRPYQKPAEPPSPELCPLMSTTDQHRPNLGDVKVPLHERLEELARLDLVTGIDAARKSVPPDENCSLEGGFGAELADAKARQHALAMIQCSRRGMERTAKVMHEAAKLHESRIIALNLPRYSEAQMLAQARAATANGDAYFEKMTLHWAPTYLALENWVRFLDSRAGTWRLEGQNFIFEHDADIQTARALQLRVAESMRE